MTTDPKIIQRHKVANFEYGLMKPSIFVYDTRKVDRRLFPERTFHTEVDNRKIDVYIRPGNYLTHRHLSLLLAIISLTAQQRLSSQDLDLPTPKDSVWGACSVSTNELLLVAGLRTGGKMNDDIEELIMGLRGVEYIDRGHVNGNIDQWATSGPVIVARREHSGPKADWFIALNERLSRALLAESGLSHRKIDLDKYRELNSLEKLIYVRLAAKYYNKRKLNKIAITTLFEEIYGYPFDLKSEIHNRRTLYARMESLKNCAINVVNSDGFEGHLDEEGRILYYTIPIIEGDNP